MRATLVLALAACGGGGGSTLDAAPGRACMVSNSASCTEAANHSDLAWIEANVFAAQCAFSGCHNGQATVAGRIDLKNPGMSHADLVNADSMIEPGRKLVVPGQPKQSYLLMMMQQFPPAQLEPTPAAPPPSDIGFMPQGTDNVPVCCQKLDAIERWITAGAPNN
jgi:hypothetical protein